MLSLLLFMALKILAYNTLQSGMWVRPSGGNLLSPCWGQKRSAFVWDMAPRCSPMVAYEIRLLRWLQRSGSDYAASFKDHDINF